MAILNTFLSLIKNKTLILSITISIFLITAIILTFIEYRLKQKLKSQEYNPKKEIKNLKQQVYKQKDAKNKLNKINLSAKKYFEKIHNLKESMDYSEIIKYFENKDKEITNFCKKMQELYYSGKKIENKEVNSLMNQLIKLIQSKKQIEVQSRKNPEPKVMQKENKTNKTQSNKKKSKR